MVLKTLLGKFNFPEIRSFKENQVLFNNRNYILFYPNVILCVKKV
jgi:hypothetical protein